MHTPFLMQILLLGIVISIHIWNDYHWYSDMEVKDISFLSRKDLGKEVLICTLFAVGLLAYIYTKLKMHSQSSVVEYLKRFLTENRLWKISIITISVVCAILTFLAVWHVAELHFSQDDAALEVIYDGEDLRNSDFIDTKDWFDDIYHNVETNNCLNFDKAAITIQQDEMEFVYPVYGPAPLPLYEADFSLSLDSQQLNESIRNPDESEGGLNFFLGYIIPYLLLSTFTLLVMTYLDSRWINPPPMLQILDEESES